MTMESKTEFATYEATVEALRKLDMDEHGLFFRIYTLDKSTGQFFLDYKVGTVRYEAMGHIYRCPAGYYCVAVEGDIWQAPVVWNGPREPKATFTNADILAVFAFHVCERLADA